MRIKSIAVLLVIFISIIFSYILMCSNVSAQAFNINSCKVYDKADVLTDEDEAVLNERIRETAKYIHMNIMIYLGNESLAKDYELAEKTTKKYIDKMYSEEFGENSDGVGIYIDLSSQDDMEYIPYDYFITKGLAQFYYTNSESNNRILSIYNNIQSYLSKGEEDIYGLIIELCVQLEENYALGICYNYYVYDEEKEKYYYLEVKENSVDGELYYSVVEGKSEPPLLQQKSFVIAFYISLISGVGIGMILFFAIRIRYIKN